jgi:hypothetical protein
VAAALRVTLRCLADDLGLGPGDGWTSVERLADESSVIRAFVDKRSQSPEGQETIEGLTSPIVAYSLHAGSDRGITWHDREIDVVWLLAARFHRSGKRDDAYPYFRGLDQAGRLMPSREDYIAHLASQLDTSHSDSLQRFHRSATRPANHHEPFRKRFWPTESACASSTKTAILR